MELVLRRIFTLFCITVICTVIASVYFYPLYTVNAEMNKWENVTPLNTTGYIFNTVSVMQDYIYLGTNHGVYVSSDRGLNWLNLNMGLSNDTDVRSISIGWVYDSQLDLYMISSSSPIFIATNTGVYENTIEGSQWVQLSATSTLNIVIDQYEATQNETASIIYVATTDGIFRGINSASPDWENPNTLIWSKQNVGLPEVQINNLITDFGNGVVYAVTNDNKIYSSSLYSAVALDENWSQVLDNAGTTTNDISILNPLGQINWIATVNGIQKSDDSGGNWITVNSGLDNKVVNTVKSDYKNQNIAYAGTAESGVYRTTTEAILDINPLIPQWLPININLSDLSISDLATNPSNSSLVYAVGENGLYRMTLNSEDDSSYNDLTPPSNIIDLTVSASSTQDYAPQLNWTAPGNNGTYGNVTSYDIRWAASPIDENNFALATPVIPMPTPHDVGYKEYFLFNNYENNIPSTGNLYFAIKSLDSAENSSEISNSVEFQRVPSIPSNLIASIISTSQINLTWNNSTDEVGVEGYYLYRCYGTGCSPSSRIATINSATSYSDSILAAGAVYGYSIVAYDASDNFATSSVVYATTHSGPSSSGGSSGSGGGGGGSYTLATNILAVSSNGSGYGTIVSNPAGILCGYSCAYPFIQKSLVTLSASPQAGSFLKSWTGCSSLNGNLCNVSLSENMSVTATFNIGTSTAVVSNIKPLLSVNISTLPLIPVEYANLKLGSTGPKVLGLQKFLNNNGALVAVSGNGSPGNETDYFGNLTESALKKYKAYLATNLANPLINTLSDSTQKDFKCPVGYICTPKSSSTFALEVSSSSPILGMMPFTQTMTVGSRGIQVMNLQKFLNYKGYIVAKSGPGSKGRETDVFGDYTKSALIQFQQSKEFKKLTPTGFFGPISIGVVNNMLKYKGL